MIQNELFNAPMNNNVKRVFLALNGFVNALNVKCAHFMVLVGRKVPFPLVFSCLKLNGKLIRCQNNHLST